MSAVLKVHKLNLIKCLLVRTSRLVSNFSLTHPEVNTILSLLASNDFPFDFMARVVVYWFHGKNKPVHPKAASGIKLAVLKLPFISKIVPIIKRNVVYFLYKQWI